MEKVLISTAIFVAMSVPVFAWEAPCNDTGCRFIIKNKTAPNSAGSFIMKDLIITTPGVGGAVITIPVTIGAQNGGEFTIPESSPCDRAFTIKFQSGPPVTDPEQINFCTITEIDVLGGTNGYYSFNFVTK